jgi:Saposin-like type B, region 2
MTHTFCECMSGVSVLSIKPMPPEHLWLRSLSQAIGAGSMINEQCKNFVRQYVPQILHIIDTMPPEQVHARLHVAGPDPQHVDAICQAWL